MEYTHNPLIQKVTKMRNIESVVKAEVAPFLDLEIPQEALGEIGQEHLDAINEIAPDGKITMRAMIQILFWVAEIGIPSRMADGDELNEELVESTIESVRGMSEALTDEAMKELVALYEGLSELSPGALLHAKMIRSGMTDLGVLTTEQTKAVGNGTGYFDNYTKLFTKRDDGWYHQDRKIDYGVFVAREAMPRDRVVVMVFRTGKPAGALFQRFSDQLEAWAQCAFSTEMKEYFPEASSKEILALLIGFAESRLKA